jgi:1-aminocyclopropane-1-carboxylate deaminase
LLSQESTINLEVNLDLFSISGYSLSIKREDLLHPHISGNKYRKLYYNLEKAKAEQFSTLLTFGGAYSNHIAAVAAAGEEFGFKTIGVIRGNELIREIEKNPTLRFANKCGMKMHFISREAYRRKTEKNFIDQLKNEFGDFYLLPEGGTNHLAVKGCQEILGDEDIQFDIICIPVGTGGTIAGIIESSFDHQEVLGFSALKGNFQVDEINKYINKRNYKMIDDYCFGGYAKIDIDLIRFINDFKIKTGIPLDPIYTGKMMFGIMDMIKNKKIKENSRILAIHSGGLQGIHGMNQVLKKKNLPQIEVQT